MVLDALCRRVAIAVCGGTRTALARPGVVMLALALSLAALAQSAPVSRAPLRVESAVESLVETVDAEGVSHFALSPVASSAGLDQLIYTVRVTNEAAQAVDGVRVTSEIPPTVRYVADSAVGPGSLALFSVDDGRTFGAPAELSVAGDDGARRAAEPADYTHVRWILSAALEAGATGFLRFRAVPR